MGPSAPLAGMGLYRRASTMMGGFCRGAAQTEGSLAESTGHQTWLSGSVLEVMESQQQMTVTC